VATAEIVRDVSTAVTENATPIFADVVPGSTQEYGLTPNSMGSPTPVFFAPQRHDGLATYWRVLMRGVVRSFFVLIAGENPSALASSQTERNAFAWERLSLELMRFSSLTPDWDCEGAEQIPQMAIKNTAVLLFLAKSAMSHATVAQCPMPLIVPAVDGGVIFKWTCGPKELKCTVRANFVEVVRWRSPDVYDSDGYWEIPIQRVAEHFKWLLQQ